MQQSREFETEIQCPSQCRRFNNHEPTTDLSAVKCNMQNCQNFYFISCCLIHFCDFHYSLHYLSSNLPESTQSTQVSISTASSTIEIQTPSTSITISPPLTAENSSLSILINISQSLEPGLPH